MLSNIRKAKLILLYIQHKYLNKPKPIIFLSLGFAEGVLLLKARRDDEILGRVEEVENDRTGLQALGFRVSQAWDLWSSYSIPRCSFYWECHILILFEWLLQLLRYLSVRFRCPFTGCPKKKVTFRSSKVLTKIECCGANFSHGHKLGSAWSCLVLVGNDQQKWFPDTGSPKPGWEMCWLLVIERVHCGSSSILKVTFLGHPVYTIICIYNCLLSCFPSFLRPVAKADPEPLCREPPILGAAMWPDYKRGAPGTGKQASFSSSSSLAS